MEQTIGDQELLTLLSVKYNTLRKRCEILWNQEKTVKLSPSEWCVLCKISGNSQSISELARRADMTRQAAHKHVRGLQQKNMVRTLDTEDRRREKHVELTVLGEQCLEEHRLLQRRMESEISRELGESRLDMLKALLDKNWF